MASTLFNKRIEGQQELSVQIAANHLIEPIVATWKEKTFALRAHWRDAKLHGLFRLKGGPGKGACMLFHRPVYGGPGPAVDWHPEVGRCRPIIQFSALVHVRNEHNAIEIALNYQVHAAIAIESIIKRPIRDVGALPKHYSDSQTG